MRITYYQDEHGGYLGVTEESPKGFTGVVFVGRGPQPGGGPETVSEQAYATDQLRRLRRVEPCDVPAEWMEAIGYEEPVVVEPEPDPEPDAEEVTVYDIRFPWEVPPPAPQAEAKPLIRDPVFQVAMLAGVIVGGLWCWWG
jgi:hypothetical protein